jgi:hypothetical protein
MRLDFFPLLNAAAELGPILLFSEGFVGFDEKPGSEDTFRGRRRRCRALDALPHLKV